MTKYPIVLTAAEVRAAEQALFNAGMPVADLMEKAGSRVADVIRQRYDPQPALILCGPGNNGGDGYVVARLLKREGWQVTVAALGEPQSETAKKMRHLWAEPCADIGAVNASPVLIDALFGIGLARPLDEALQKYVRELADGAMIRIAVDLPSGISTDDGALLGDVPDFDLTVALGALKPAHVKQPGAAKCGEIVLADIGLPMLDDRG